MSPSAKRDLVAHTIAGALLGPATFDLWSPDYQAEILEAAEEVLDEAGRSADLTDAGFHKEIAKAVARGLDGTGDGDLWTPDYEREMSAVSFALAPILRSTDV